MPLDISEGRNFEVEKSLKEKIFGGSGVLKRRADDAEHEEIWSTRGGIYKTSAWKYFYYKWSDTWSLDPEKEGWVKNWSQEFKNSPPDLMKSKITLFYRYTYFEKDIYDLHKKKYLI